jgi:hypothetical protein
MITISNLTLERIEEKVAEAIEDEIGLMVEAADVAPFVSDVLQRHFGVVIEYIDEEA